MPTIGVFDSGVGGLSVLREMRRVLPSANLVYVADSRYVPYGDKAPEFVRERSAAIARFLVDSRHANALVVACNTATTHAVEHLRALLPTVPIVGMEPAIKPAAQATVTGVVGVFATGSTLDSARFADLMARTAAGVRVVIQPCPGLVEQVEAGDLRGERTIKLLEQYARPLVDAGADTIVLGCTHYPFLREPLQAIVGPSVTLIDTAEAVARQTARVLGIADRAADVQREGTDAGSARGTVSFFTSGDPIGARPIFERLWGEPVAAVLPRPTLSDHDPRTG